MVLLRHPSVYLVTMLLLCGSYLVFELSKPRGSELTGLTPNSIAAPRERLAFNDDWRFYKYGSEASSDELIYDVRPEVFDNEDGKAADAMPEQAVAIEAKQAVLKPWIMPSANAYILNPQQHHLRPPGNPGADFPFVQTDFDDSRWQRVRLPHDWAIEGPFMAGWDAEVGGGMGRLPSHGVGWYRKTFSVPKSDEGKSVFLDIDGAMSYAMVWVNGQLAGGWPYGYASWRVDLTPYLRAGTDNQIALRLDNPNSSSRWYPGGGLYRNVWLTKVHPIHVGHYGTFITSTAISSESATINMQLNIDNKTAKTADVSAAAEVFLLNEEGNPESAAVATIAFTEHRIPAGKSINASGRTSLAKPKLWGPPPKQQPNLYLAVTTIKSAGKVVDRYETRFGIRELRFDAREGLFVNGEKVYIQGVNQHHDLGALGAAFNVRAAQRQLEILREMGVNAIRTAHNPPAPELLALTDSMGFLVLNEIFDVWARKKTPLDFHLIFPDWHEADLRAFIRRDRNSPSVIMWSIGNEVGEQYTAEEGAAIAKTLHDIAKQEDPTRPTAASMNYAKPDMPFAAITDSINLNYQGEGIRNAPGYAHLKGIRTAPLYPAFHKKFPDKLILSSENAAALSSRGEYLFPVTADISAPVEDGAGGDPASMQVSAYELYTAPFGSSADKVLGSLAQHPYVGGGFVWSGWDYLGEPTPYYLARSSYFGVIDLAGFKKDRFYLYQAHWRPDFPMVHILPHWNWPQRIGEVTPVHAFTSGDEAELFLNGKSLGRKKKATNEFRLRWDDVVYTPGELKIVAYKNGARWAETATSTTNAASALALSSDRHAIRADGQDLSFITVRVMDNKSRTVPTAKHQLQFELDGPGEIVATDNGDPTNLVTFKARQRAAFNGLCLVIVRGQVGQKGVLTLTAKSKGLSSAKLQIVVKDDADSQ